ncbi:hypothetical protein [Streptomyces sp. NBC_00102]|uniref:hypothetical protein n=1 Tax=Streptomyces sp. NBC_00102 TaxID=2975652 RepID=UPI00225109C6|nr:hypothetical protein [Streptomyces sp. NBC_00102]MCX5397274.1 hypothetical protein [Streptomyces sp. NBC_00102]
MTLPSWTDENLGTMKRAALWLVTVVGEDSIFTKEQLKAALPGVSQVDRRVRDLRDHGWQIHNSRDDITLSAHEQRFVKMGAPVWEPGKATKSAGTLTATQRREVLSRDGHFCRSCGITPGESYEDGTYESAQIDIARRAVSQPDGSEEIQLVSECNRCRVGGRSQLADLGAVLTSVEGLGALARKMLAGWVAKDKREFSEAERIWGAYRSLPADSRDAVREALSAE